MRFRDSTFEYSLLFCLLLLIGCSLGTYVFAVSLVICFSCLLCVSRESGIYSFDLCLFFHKYGSSPSVMRVCLES